MRPFTDLSKFRSAFDYRLLRLRKSYASILSGADPNPRQGLPFVVIELDNLVLSGLREYTLSTLRGARTVGGIRIKVNQQFGPSDQIGAFIMSVVQNYTYQKLGQPASVSRTQEPTIRDPRQTEKVLVQCGASNLVSLQNALALNTSLFSDLATLRNFYAHRNEDTWRKVRNKALNMGAYTISHPDQLSIHLIPGRPVSVLQDWLDDAELFFHEATQ